MRTIKFRGKRLTDGAWIYGDFFRNRGLSFIASDGIAENPLATWRDYNVDPETVGQFTGLHDKNGKEIYEGDLIRSPSGLVYTVIFGTWVHDEKKEFPKIIDKYEHTGWCISLDGNTPCELLDSEVYSGVITGNVHDNPSLLKVNSAGNI